MVRKESFKIKFKKGEMVETDYVIKLCLFIN
jgi:hypothetical protein